MHFPCNLLSALRDLLSPLSTSFDVIKALYWHGIHGIWRHKHNIDVNSRHKQIWRHIFPLRSLSSIWLQIFWSAAVRAAGSSTGHWRLINIPSKTSMVQVKIRVVREICIFVSMLWVYLAIWTIWTYFVALVLPNNTRYSAKLEKNFDASSVTSKSVGSPFFGQKNGIETWRQAHVKNIGTLYVKARLFGK